MRAQSSGIISRRRKRVSDADFDITPMIDVTFLLLIFFMVTSTMHPTREKNIPPAFTGTSANAGRFVDLSVTSPRGASGDGQLLLEGNLVTLDLLASELSARSLGGRVDLMIYAERDVRNGFVGDVEEVVSGVEGDVDYSFAVRDRR